MAMAANCLRTARGEASARKESVVGVVVLFCSEVIDTIVWTSLPLVEKFSRIIGECEQFDTFIPKLSTVLSAYCG